MTLEYAAPFRIEAQPYSTQSDGRPDAAAGPAGAPAGRR